MYVKKIKQLMSDCRNWAWMTYGFRLINDGEESSMNDTHRNVSGKINWNRTTIFLDTSSKRDVEHQIKK